MRSIWVWCIGVFVLVGCKQRELYPPLTLQRLDPSDSIAAVHLLGDESSAVDSVRLGADSITIHPDTTRYRALYVEHSDTLKTLRHYILSRGVWHECDPEPKLDALTVSAPSISGRDASGREHYISGWHEKQRVAVVFSDVNLNTHTKAQRDSLRRLVRPDSLAFVYMMLTPSDSVARARIKQDTLRGIIFSDTTGLVSRMRIAYGIERAVERTAFVLDSAGTRAMRVVITD